MKPGRSDANQQQHRKGSSIFSDWALCLWFGLSFSFLALLYVTRKDGILSQTDRRILPLVFILTIISCKLIFSRLFSQTLRKKEIIFFSIFLGIIGVFQFAEQIHPSLFLINNFEITVTKLDKDADIELDWAYWAVEPQKSDPDPDEFLRSFDISFDTFEKSDNWELTQQGTLSAKTENARIKYTGDHFSNFVPILHFRINHGGGTLSVNYNGKIRKIDFQSDDQKSISLIGFTGTIWSRILSGIIFSIALASLFACFAFFIRFVYDLQIIRKSCWISAGSFFIPIFLLLVVCAVQNIYPFGEKTFLVVDMNQMYSDMLAYLKTLFSGRNNLLYTFSKNLGGDMLSPYAFYLGNPINFIICLFSQQDLPKAVSFLILFKLGICGFSSNLYFRKDREPSFTSLIFSTCYALMAYNLVNAENMHFIEGAIWLPLTALGIEKIIDERKPFLYIVSLFLILVINFYFGYMVCIFSIFFFTYKILLRGTISHIRQYKDMLFQFIFGSLAAAGGSAFLLIPIFFKLSNGTKNFQLSNLSLSPNFQFVDLFSKIFTGAHNEYEIDQGLPTIFCGILITTLMILFFLNQQISTKEKLLTFFILIVFVISFYINAFNLIWHGLNQPVWWPYRYSFIFCFLMIMTARRCFLHIGGISFKAVCLCIVFYGLISITVISYSYAYISINNVIIDNLLNLFFCILLLTYNRSIKPFSRFSTGYCTGFNNFLIMAFCFANLYQNAEDIWKINYSDSTRIDDYKEFVNTVNPVVERIKKGDESFYRTEKTFQRDFNDALQFGYNGLSHYSSTTNRKVFDFLVKMGIAQFHYWTRYEPGSTASVDSLLGIKYLIAENDQIDKPFDPIFSENGLTVFQNPLALPFGFSVSKETENCVIQSIDLFETQNQVFKCLAGKDLGNLFSTPKTVTYAQNYPDIGENTTQIDLPSPNPKEELFSEWSITIDNPDTLYVHIPRSEEVSSVYEVYLNDSFLIKNESVIESGILPLGRFTPGETITLRLKWLSQPYPVDQTQFGYENQTLLEKYFAVLNREPVTLNKISSSHLNGTYSINSENRLLFFSIPYEEDWRIFIDGEKTDQKEIFGALMSVDTIEGTHSIEMSYLPKGLITGSVISTISIILFVFWACKRPRKFQQD